MKRNLLLIFFLQFSSLFGQNIKPHELSIRQQIISNFNNIFPQYFNHLTENNIYDKLKFYEEEFSINYSSINLIPNTRNSYNVNDTLYKSYYTIKELQLIHTLNTSFQFYPNRLTLTDEFDTLRRYSYDGLGVINCSDNNGFNIRDSLELTFTILYNSISQEFKIESLFSAKSIPYYILLLNKKETKKGLPISIPINANGKEIKPLDNTGTSENFKFNDKYALKIYSDTIIKLTTKSNNFTVKNKIRIQGNNSNVIFGPNEYGTLRIRKIIEFNISNECGNRNFKVGYNSSIHSKYTSSLYTISKQIYRNNKFIFDSNFGFFNSNIINIYENNFYLENYNQIDSDGDAFQGVNSFSFYNEILNFHISGISTGLNFGYLIGEKFYVEYANNFYISLNTRVQSTQIAEYIRKGTYNNSLYNIQISENGIYNFGSHLINHTENKVNTQLTFSSLNSTIGIAYKLSKNAHLSLGCSFHQVNNYLYDPEGILLNDNLSVQGLLFNKNIDKYTILGIYFKTKIRI